MILGHYYGPAPKNSELGITMLKPEKKDGEADTKNIQVPAIRREEQSMPLFTTRG